LQAYIEQLQWWIPQPALAVMTLNNPSELSLSQIVDQSGYWADKYLKTPPIDNRIKKDVTVYGDRVQLQLLIFNLVHNAKRFTLDDNKAKPVVLTAIEDDEYIRMALELS
jgi:signal transduction histidine kinase